MRLTLRTMLAYLDNMLEPADAQELGKKIEQSEFASNLVHHIRASTRRLRLAAPGLDGKGLGHDPNTVAEYLDNTLPQDRIPEFEKICLESDMHLSEVASCHQILALVLGESADVEPAIRDRVYRVHTGVASGGGLRRDDSQSTNGRRDAGGTKTRDTAQALRTSASDDNDASPARPRPEVPEYLRPAGIRIKPLVITLAVAFLLVTIGLLLLGPLNSKHPVLGRLFPVRSTQPSADKLSNTPPTGPAAPGKTLADAGNQQPPEVPAAGPRQDSPPDATPSPVVSTDSASEVPPGPDASELRPSESRVPAGSDPDSGTRSDAPTTPIAGAAVAAGDRVKANTDSDQRPFHAGPADHRVTAPKSSDPAGDPVPTPPADDADTNETATDASHPDSEPPMTRTEVGRYLSEQQVLVRREQQSENWRRLVPLTTLSSADQLVALPGFRPQIALMSGVHVTFLGESAVELGPAIDDGVASMVIEQGRLLFFTDGTVDGARIALVLGARQGVLSFESSDAMAAIEVRPYLFPGTDPESGVAQRVVQIIVTAGEVEWTERSDNGAATPFSIRAGQVHTLLNDQPGQTVAAGTPPAWVEPGRGAAGVDGVAAKALERLLDLERPVSVGLHEQLSYRQADVRSLTARCLSQLDQFEPLIDQFNDKDLRSYWSSAFDAIELAIARHPQTAAAVRAAIDKRRPDNAQLLYRMLWGYSPEQLENDGARQLVKALEAPHVDVRVLAAENLRRITGKMYFADKEPERQKAALVRWKHMERDKQIVYKTPPSPFPNAAPPDSSTPAAER